MEPKVEIPVVYGVTKSTFLKTIYPKREPVLLRGLDIGPCVDKWSVEYLASTSGPKSVKIHVSPNCCMDFINKNFAYRTLPFDEFVKRAAEERHEKYFISEDEKYYLRCLGDDPRKDIADIKKQFPQLAPDIHLPEFYEADRFFSSVFRIGSAGIQLWTHYDVMDNLLVQVLGNKRVVLFSPKDTLHLYLNGDKSQVLDIDKPDLQKYPKFAKATKYECLMQPGDVLFIPALWFHNVTSLDFGVAVNVFWRHLDSDCYDQKDPYGNKDPVAVTRAMQILDRALKSLEELPVDYRDFYARRMVARIQAKQYSHDPAGS